MRVQIARSNFSDDAAVGGSIVVMCFIAAIPTGRRHRSCRVGPSFWTGQRHSDAVPTAEKIFRAGHARFLLHKALKGAWRALDLQKLALRAKIPLLALRACEGNAAIGNFPVES
jgi:hypothetical protein